MSPRVLNGVRVARSSVFSVMFHSLQCLLWSFYLWTLYCLSFIYLRHLITPSGADPGGGGGPPAPAPPKIGKNMIFLRKIVIFHTKYLKYFRAFLRSAQFF